MGRAWELLNGLATEPSTTFEGLTMSAGNSLTIRNAGEGPMARLVQVWADNQAAGTLRIRSPYLHDNVQGIRLDVAASDLTPLLPWGTVQPLYSQDTLIVELTGSATSGDLELASLLVYYDDLPGVQGRFHTPEEVIPRIEGIVAVENTLATGTAGGWSGEEALDAEFDLLRANRDYALLGYLVDAECCAVRWRGSETGNLGIGGPGDVDGRHYTSNWFERLSTMYGLPAIPVFNASNKSSILIDAAQDENGTDVTVTSILGQLAP